MFIKSIEIEGVEENVCIERTDDGARVWAGNRRDTRTLLYEVRRDEPREARFAKSLEAAGCICGRGRGGEPNATNSMLHEICNEIDRVAGC